MSKLAVVDGNFLAGSYPEGVRWDAPIEKMTLVEMFNRAVEKYADLPCINMFGKRISFRELDELTNRAAKGFQNMGVKKGDRVGLYMPNTQWHQIMFFGALKAGAVVVNFSTAYVEKELEHQAEDSGTSILVTADTPEPDTYKNATNLLKKGKFEKVIVFNLSDTLGKDRSWLPGKMRFGLPLVKVLNRLKNFFNFAVKDKITYVGKFMKNDGDFQPVPLDPDDVAVLQYTGGTSGVPKGAVLTHDNLAANVQQVSEYIVHKEGMRDNPYMLRAGESAMFSPLPFFHVFAMTATMLTTIHNGNETVMALNPRDLEGSLKIIDRFKPDFAAAVPKQIEGAVNSRLLRQYDHSSLKGIVTGGAATPTALQTTIIGKCNARLFPGWGLSETAPILTVNPLHGAGKLGSAGKPVPGVEIRVCDVSDPAKVLNVGETGELQARGRNIMKGYWNKPAETAEVMTGDGWFRTGDVGHVDDEGDVFITDRLKRMINVMGTGKKAWPAHIENEIANLEEVAECVVVAVNKNTEREAGKAFIRFHEGKTLAEDALKEKLASRLSPLEIPRYFEFVTEPLPVTSINKPDWKKLEDMEAAKAKNKAPAPGPG